MPTATKINGVQFNNQSFNVANICEFDSPLAPVITLPAGKTVTSWVKTDANTAACNLPAGHGYSNGTFDVYWVVADVWYRRTGVPGTIITNAITLDGGAGTDFPASATVGVVVTRQVEITFAIDGDTLQFFALVFRNLTDTDCVGNADVQDSSDVSLVEYGLIPDSEVGGVNDTTCLDIQNGDTNPISGDVAARIMASNSSVTADATLYVFAGYDGTPWIGSHADIQG